MPLRPASVHLLTIPLHGPTLLFVYLQPPPTSSIFPSKPVSRPSSLPSSAFFPIRLSVPPMFRRTAILRPHLHNTSGLPHSLPLPPAGRGSIVLYRLVGEGKEWDGRVERFSWAFSTFARSCESMLYRKVPLFSFHVGVFEFSHDVVSYDSTWTCRSVRWWEELRWQRVR